jgi:hemerythrin-like domain-containing protein
MADAIDNLTAEHRLIEQVLGSLETFGEKVGQAPESDRRTVGDFAEFFHQLVDRCHHGKEEQYLFVRMSSYGFSNEAGPVSAMLSEQGEGRDHLSALQAIGEGSGPLSKREQTLVKGHALGYILRIISHMKREDEILFPVARHVLPPFAMQELTVEFEKFDQNAENRPIYEKLFETAKRLSGSYPPKSSGKAAKEQKPGASSRNQKPASPPVGPD